MLVRRADSSSEGFTQFTYNTSSNAHHTHGDVQHSHFHVPAAHEDSDATKSFLDAYTAGTTQLSNQNELGMSYKLNDVIPLAPYYFYNGVFNTTGEITYDNCTSLENININVIVFDIKNGIPISSDYAAAISATYNACLLYTSPSPRD